ISSCNAPLIPPNRTCSLLLAFFCSVAGTSYIYTLSLHDALPICTSPWCLPTITCTGSSRSERPPAKDSPGTMAIWLCPCRAKKRSEEHTSELQSPDHLVCRLLLEKKKGN